MVRDLPYGAWPSPITPHLLTVGAAQPRQTWAAGGTTWWSESRPAEGGRIQIVRQDADGSRHELLPEGWSARTRVHEYGGGDWWVHRGTLYFTAWADQRLYRLGLAPIDPQPICPPPPGPGAWRYADGRVTPDGSVVICIRESHVPDGTVRNELVALPAAGGEVAVLVSGHDFVAAPRISPDGRRLAWLAWDHPRMPWDGTQLWIGELVVPDAATATDTPPSGTPLGGAASTPISVLGARPVAGGTAESLAQPEWGPDGSLYVISDRSQWWNVYRVDIERDELERVDLGRDPADPDLFPTPEHSGRLHPVYPVAADVCPPAWVLGGSRYAVGADGAVWLTHLGHPEGAPLIRVDPDGEATQWTLDAVDLDQLRLDGERIVAIAARTDREPEVVELRGAEQRVLCPARALPLSAAGISRPRRISFPSADGRTAHAWFHPPAGTDPAGTPLGAPHGTRPPLIVQIHGGPTAAASPAFSLRSQFWTSRGFALLDVDHGGSTGYGRDYRQLLDGQWGVVDVQDACAAAAWVADQGWVDPDRMAIRGGSAGGFTTLRALLDSTVFSAGASYYGVVDLGALARDTHKFEAHYTDRLIGPFPQAEQLYRERSPLTQADRLDVPLLVLQGLEDAVVPPAQAEAIVAALERRGVPHCYLTFEGEQHGFKRAETIVASVGAELAFYGLVFGFTPDGDLPPLPLRHPERLGRPRPDPSP